MKVIPQSGNVVLLEIGHQEIDRTPTPGAKRAVLYVMAEEMFKEDCAISVLGRYCYPPNVAFKVTLLLSDYTEQTLEHIRNIRIEPEL